MTKETLRDWYENSGKTIAEFADWLGLSQERQFKKLLSGENDIKPIVEKVYNMEKEIVKLKRLLREEQLRVNLSHKSKKYLKGIAKVLKEQIEEVESPKKYLNEEGIYHTSQHLRIASYTIKEDHKALKNIETELGSRK